MNDITKSQEEQLRSDYLNTYALNKKKQSTLDELTELACKLTGSSKAVISIVEDQKVWFKSQYGIKLKSENRAESFFAETINSPDAIIYYKDLRKSDKFKNHPLVNKKNDPIIFYAGIGLKTLNNLAVGTLSILDSSPRELTKDQERHLEIVAHLVMSQLRLRKRNLELSEKSLLLKENNDLLTQFAHVVSHDMKMPLANMILTADVLKKKYGTDLDAGALKYLEGIKESAFHLSDYIGNILNHYESDNLLKDEKDISDIYSILENVTDLLVITDDVTFDFPESNLELVCNTAALSQIFLNLIGNSLKYNDKENIIIEVQVSQNLSHYIFKVEDNGRGISKENLKDIFKLFTTLGTVDRYGKKGNGIGLSTVHKLVTKMGGKIKVKSTVGKSTSFKFTILK